MMPTRSRENSASDADEKAPAREALDVHAATFAPIGAGRIEAFHTASEKIRILTVRLGDSGPSHGFHDPRTSGSDRVEPAAPTAFPMSAFLR